MARATAPATADRACGVKTGTVISGTGHGALILWLILGDVFTAEPLPFDLETTDVTLVSAEEFSFMTASNAAPQAETDAPDVAPPAQDTAPQAAQVSEAAPQCCRSPLYS